MARFRIFFGQVSVGGNYSLSASTGSFALVGADTDFIYAPILHYSLPASAGLFSLAGADVDLVYTPALPDYVYLRPGGDTALDGWTDQADGTSNIYQSIDETSASDTDYVQSPPITASGSGTLSIGDLVANTGSFLFGTVAFQKISQSFISAGTSISKIRLKIGKSSNPTDSAHVGIFTADASHKPVTQIGSYSSAIPYTAISDTPSVHEFVFAIPISVTSGVEYCFTVERTVASFGGNCYEVVVVYPDSYTAGQLYYWNGAWQGDYATFADMTCEIDFVGAGGEASANLTVRLFDGSTEIVEWTHSDVAETFVDAEQTLTTPQYEAITDFANLFVELDDGNDNVYRFALGDPPGDVDPPINVRYRYKKLVA